MHSPICMRIQCTSREVHGVTVLQVPNYTANFLESREEDCVHLKGDCLWTPSSTEYIQEVLTCACLYKYTSTCIHIHTRLHHTMRTLS